MPRVYVVPFEDVVERPVDELDVRAKVPADDEVPRAAARVGRQQDRRARGSKGGIKLLITHLSQQNFPNLDSRLSGHYRILAVSRLELELTRSQNMMDSQNLTELPTRI